MNRCLDQASAIMIAIEHCGNVLPGQKCSAIFMDKADIAKEKAFIERFCSGNGMQDPVLIEMMVSSQVPQNPYWLISIKPLIPTADAVFHRVDDLTGKVI